MAVRVVEMMREEWGDEFVTAFVPWMDERVEKFVREKSVPRDEYREVLSRLDVLEHDVSLIREGQAQTRAEFREEQAQTRAEFRSDLGELRREMHERFDRVNERFDQMGQRFEARLDQMNERMLVQTRWLIGSIALFGTIVTIMVAIAQFTP